MSSPIISMVKHAAATETQNVSADAIIKAIKGGKWKKQIKEIRNTFDEILRRTGDRKAAKQAVDDAKKKLPGILCSGTFSRRANEAIIQHSGLLCADLDQIGADKLPAVRVKLAKSEHAYALFRSPTGDGLKAIFRVPADSSKHLASFRAVERHVRELTGIDVDQSCKDVARMCFVSHDLFAYSNPNASEIAPLPEPQNAQAAGAAGASTTDLAVRQRIAANLIGEIQWDSETHGLCTCPGKHLHTTGDGQRDCEIHLDGAATIHCFHDHCHGIRDALNRELRSQIAKTERAHPPIKRVQRLTSLNSPFLPSAECDDYPRRLGVAAYHGLAGEIVRSIEPHTEADPVALLFQFLAAFGNLIGRDHYIVADGTPHYLNLYGVLVGQSSKGRKGTSWNHIANLMECVDANWREDRISFGLSSGEGLIWAVRDPVQETRPIRKGGQHTGEYETYIANHGEADKRLFIIEAEFANVLKVTAREGNTLSPIIRCAWDSGDLKTMVKNSPAKATRAHVSIVGHITRDELRRLLTQTESANGFANRFCWLAVKRSKCLPDGGAIHMVNFDDVVAQLRSAIDFAKDFVEIHRDPEAKKLWHEVYPKLSEGSPGMLGAITARAEAQVMRVSAIYAFLDKSHLIRPEHHQAAMALWKYCEESCRWIFGTRTGDRNADKILVALRHAANGMTKTEISVEVFNRHASSTEIDEALRLLHGLQMASYRTEASGGAPIERWFSTDQDREISEKSQGSPQKPPNNSLISRSSMTANSRGVPNVGPNESPKLIEELI
jgi:BT4734-like, N-terminal domain